MRALLAAFVALFLAFGLAASAHAQDVPGLSLDPLGSLTPMSDLELGEERGGLKTPYGEIDFGAVVRTFVDGQIALETELDWTEAGAVQSQALGILQNELDQKGLALTASLEGANPSVIIGGANGGSTTILHEVTNEQIANVVINSASNREIRLETNITLVMPDLTLLQDDLAAQQLQIGLHDAIGQALVAAGL